MDTPECPVGGPAVHNSLHGIDHAVRVAAQHACLLPESAIAKCAQPFDRKRHAGRSAMRRIERSQAVCGGDASLRRRQSKQLLLFTADFTSDYHGPYSITTGTGAG